jgi:hypothetical protein
VNLPGTKTEIIAKQPRRFQKQMACQELPILNEPGFVGLAKTGAKLRFEIVSQRYQRPPHGSTAVLPCSRQPWLPYTRWDTTSTPMSPPMSAIVVEAVTVSDASDNDRPKYCLTIQISE